MKKRFTEAQIIGFLGEAEAGLPVKQLCRRQGFSEASYYAWRVSLRAEQVRRPARLGRQALERDHGRWCGTD